MLKEYFSIAEILELRLHGYASKPKLIDKILKEEWLYRTYKTTKKDGKEYHISNFPSATRELIATKLIEKTRKLATKQGGNLNFLEDSLQVTYSRLEIVLFLQTTKMNKEIFCAKYNGRELTNIELSSHVYEYIPNVSVRSIYRWLKSYDAIGLEGLKYKPNERKLGKSHYLNEQKINIKELVEGMLLEQPHLKSKVIYKFLQHYTVKQNISIPCYRTICGYIASYKNNQKSSFLLAKNPDAWKSKYLLGLGSYSEEAVEPNYIWELDSSPADIMLEGGRYMLLACIDVHSRRVKFLVQKTSNSYGVTNLLRQCMLEWGIPKIIKTDNGKDYTSQQIKITLKEFNIEHRLANPFQGQEKPHVERVFKRFQHDILEALPNFLGHSVAERKAIESIKSFADRLFGKTEILYLTANKFQAYCNYWVQNHYMNQPHAGLNKKTPASMLKNFTPNFPVGEQLRKLDLLLETLVGKRMISKKGIKVENNNYFNPMLAMQVGEQVIIRVDRFDMGKVYVFDEGHNFICEAVNYELLGKDKPAFIQQSKAIQKQLMKQLKSRSKKLINKIHGTSAYIQVDIEQAVNEVLEEEKLKTNQSLQIVSNSIILTPEQAVIQQRIAKKLQDKFIIPENKDEEFRLFLFYKEQALSGVVLSNRIQDWLEMYPESIAGKTRIKSILQHDVVRGLYKASSKLISNLEALIH